MMMNRHKPAQGSAPRLDPYQLPLTLHDHTLAQAFELGEPQEKYLSASFPHSQGCTQYVMFPLLLLLGLMFVGSTTYIWFGHWPGVDPVGNLILFGIGLILLISALISSPVWPRISATYLICTQGLLCHRPLAVKQRDLAIRWNRISFYYYKNNGLQLTLIWQDDTGGASRKVLISISNPSAKEVSRIGDAILERINRMLIPQAVERLRQGERLAFGPFTIDQSDIQYQDQHFLWEQVERCTVQVRGAFTLRLLLVGKDGQLLVRSDCSRIPNLFVLMAAIGGELEARERKVHYGP
jgi:hypothetical protein